MCMDDFYMKLMLSIQFDNAANMSYLHIGGKSERRSRISKQACNMCQMWQPLVIFVSELASVLSLYRHRVKATTTLPSPPPVQNHFHYSCCPRTCRRCPSLTSQWGQSRTYRGRVTSGTLRVPSAPPAGASTNLSPWSGPPGVSARPPDGLHLLAGSATSQLPPQGSHSRTNASLLRVIT